MSASHHDHHSYMGRALSLARRGLGRTSPNPAVGCVIVRGGQVVGEGWHRRAGTSHAEVHALQMAGELARGADLYVTLEPCSHHGRTPPCADALIGAGIARVFAGTVDPNPKVSGRGLDRLRAAGIAVVTGMREEECRRLIEPFAKHVTTGRPFVILKSAMTLDGRTATATGDARWISSERSRLLVHRLRDQVDAVMVGSGTLLADDPQLTARIRGGRDPLRVIVDSRLRIPLDAKVLHLASPASTLVATIVDDTERLAGLTGLGAQVLVCHERDGRVDLGDLLDRLGRQGVQSVLLEGGETLAGEALRAGLIDKFLFFYAPKLMGGGGPGLFGGPGAVTMAGAWPVRVHQVRRCGGDIFVEAYPEERCSPV